MGQFGSFKLIKNYTETTKLNDEKFISTEASYRGHQSSRMFKFVFSQRFWFVYSKNDFFGFEPK